VEVNLSLFNFDNKWRSIAVSRLVTLFTAKECQCALNRRQSELQSRSGCFGKQKNLLHLKGIETENKERKEKRKGIKKEEMKEARKDEDG